MKYIMEQGGLHGSKASLVLASSGGSEELNEGLSQQLVGGAGQRCDVMTHVTYVPHKLMI